MSPCSRPNISRKGARCSWCRLKLRGSWRRQHLICARCWLSFSALARGSRKPSNWSGETSTSKAGERFSGGRRMGSGASRSCPLGSRRPYPHCLTEKGVCS